MRTLFLLPLLLLSLVLTFALSGCPSAADDDDTSDDDDAVDDDDTALLDTDGDGVPDVADCAPEDPTRYPGATDVPDDGIDQDCNGSDTVTCFIDVDGDGFAGLSTVLSQIGNCDAPGLFDVSEDCDDGNVAVHPGAAETVEDGIDQDCNGFDSVNCFVDSDGDGAGSTSTAISEDEDCDDTGESSSSDDCDDADGDRFPAAVEVCDSAMDLDCDGLDACADSDCWTSALCEVLLGADGQTGLPGDLYRIDPLTGAGTSIGAIGYAITGLALAPDGLLYGSEATRSGSLGPARLILIDRVTGAGTPVGELWDGSLNHGSTADLCFVGTDLFGWSEFGDDPIHIDTNTGAVTVIASTGVSSSGSGMATAADGTVWFVPGRVNGSLYTIDVSTGIGTIGPSLSGGTHDNLNSMTFVNGVLYGVEVIDDADPTTAAQLVTIDTSTGVITPVGDVPPGLDALAGWPP